jgi:hypothetical protein
LAESQFDGLAASSDLYQESARFGGRSSGTPSRSVAEWIFRSRPVVAAVGKLDRLEAFGTLARRLAA